MKETLMSEETIEVVEPDDDDPIDVTRGDEGYDDTEEGADESEWPVPSVYGAEDVGGEES